MTQQEFNFGEWVDKNSDLSRLDNAKMVHHVLFAISNSLILRDMMILKGGTLMALLFDSSRRTTDIDFSTDQMRVDFHQESFVDEFNRNLKISENQLEYGFLSDIQSVKFQPKEGITFPTLQITIGFALAGNIKEIKRLEQKNSLKTIRIDFSFNEPSLQIAKIMTGQNQYILTYGKCEVIAEKFRALIQQATRKHERQREQDVYDLYKLLSDCPPSDLEEKQLILNRLIEKGKIRDIDISKETFSNPKIKENAGKNYPALKYDIFGDLPDFDLAFDTLLQFYLSLPWERVEH